MKFRHSLNPIVTFFVRQVHWFVAGSAVLLLFGGFAYLITETQCVSTAYRIHVMTFLGFQSPFELTTSLATITGVVGFIAFWLIVPEVIALTCANVIEKMKERVRDTVISSTFRVFYDSFVDAGQSHKEAENNAWEAAQEFFDKLGRKPL